MKLINVLSLSQSSLDDIITCQQKIPNFTNLGLLDHIIELIICEDEVMCNYTAPCHVLTQYILTCPGLPLD
jgi:hypothetical protein